MSVRCGNCGTVFDSAEQVCPTCGRGVEDVGIEEPALMPHRRPALDGSMSPPRLLVHG